MFTLDESPVADHKKSAYDRLLSGPLTPIYVLGRNKYAQRVSTAVLVEGFVDDFTNEKEYMGRPIIRMAEMPTNCIVVSCVIDTVPVTGLNKLAKRGLQDVVDFFALSRLDPHAFGEVDYCSGNREDILNNRDQYEWVYNRLADELSRRHFEKVIQFRFSMDLEHMRGFTLAIDRQYFEDFFARNPAAVFVDGGGYDGQTTLAFTAWNGSYDHIYYFEPAPAMMQVSRRKLAGIRDIEFVQKGLFSRNDKLRFDAEAGPASSLSASGQTEIEVVRLDDALRQPVTFLKLDVEGAEVAAIEGAANQIRSHSPALAVCVYHNQAHFWQVPRRVMELNNSYKIYLRHYSESIRETVMFFVPAPR